ncbi:MAG: hypothetical protein PVS3B3_35260 [Ktedonobacteraceae bacterium]
MSPRERGRHTWREPSHEQIALEKRMARIIKAFIRYGYLDVELNFVVVQSAQDELAQEIASLLQQAHAIGSTIGQNMVDVQENVVGNVAKSFVDRARDIVIGIVDRVRELVQNAIGNREDGVDPEQAAQDAVDNAAEQLPDLIVETEVPSEIESAVMGVMRQGGVAMVRCVCSPGACARCMDNESQGAIPIGEAFADGSTSAPFHNRCRCNMVSADG